MATDLEQRGISVGVVSARWVKPLDPRIVDWAESASHVVTLEDNVLAGGFGAAVMEALTEASIVKKVTRIGVPDRFLPFGSQEDIIRDAEMDADTVLQRVLTLLNL